MKTKTLLVATVICLTATMAVAGIEVLSLDSWSSGGLTTVQAMTVGAPLGSYMEVVDESSGTPIELGVAEIDPVSGSAIATVPSTGNTLTVKFRDPFGEVLFTDYLDGLEIE